MRPRIVKYLPKVIQLNVERKALKLWSPNTKYSVISMSPCYFSLSNQFSLVLRDKEYILIFIIKAQLV